MDASNSGSEETSQASMKELLGITYSEFDNVVGPQLRFQYPEKTLSSETFEDVSSYVIVGKHLSERILTVQIHSQDDSSTRQFMNFSVAIENPKYDRNTLLFAIGFVLSEGVDCEIYEPVLKKIARTLIALETESEYLFQDANKTHLRQVFAAIYRDLSQKKEIFVVPSLSLCPLPLYYVRQLKYLMCRVLMTPTISAQS